MRWRHGLLKSRVKFETWKNKQQRYTGLFSVFAKIFVLKLSVWPQVKAFLLSNLARLFLYPEIQDGGRKPKVVLFWHVWFYLNDIWVDYYVLLVGKLNATIVIHTRIHLDVTFQDGGEKAPEPHWIWDRRHANAVNVMCKTEITSGLWSPFWKIDLQ